MVSINIEQLHVSDLIELYRDKELSPVTVTEYVLDKIKVNDSKYNIFAHIDEELALEQALKSEQRWKNGTELSLIDGVPTTVKDLSDVKNMPTKYGSLTFKNAEPANKDSIPVQRLREDGAIFLGKTTTPEFGHKGVTDSLLNGITKNPHNPEKTTGGSSGGAAAAACKKLGLLHLGSDGGGSLRIPASFTGVFGFKPSHDLVTVSPAHAHSELSVNGAITNSVKDAGFMLNTITKPDPNIKRKFNYKQHDFINLDDIDIANLKIAYSNSINDIQPNSDVNEVFNIAIDSIKSINNNVTEIKLELPKLIATFNQYWMASAHHIVSEFSLKQQELMDKRFLNWAERGSNLSLLDYKKAEINRFNINQIIYNLLGSYDLIITPTTAMTAFDTGGNMPYDKNGELWDDWTPYTYPANIAGIPAASMPCGFSKDKMPVGLQVMSRFDNDDNLLKACYQFEKIFRSCK